MCKGSKLHLVVCLQVCLLVIAQGYLGIAMKISATMMKRGHLKETAKVSRYLVAAGHGEFKRCLVGERLPSLCCPMFMSVFGTLLQQQEE